MFDRPLGRPRADSSLSAVAGASPRQHHPIAEFPELESASTSPQGAPTSRLTEGLRKYNSRQSESRVKPRPSESSTEGRSASVVPEVVVTNENEPEMAETTPLLPRERLSSYNKYYTDPEASVDDDPHHQPGTWDRVGHHYPSLRHTPSKISHLVVSPKKWDMRSVARKVIVEPVNMLPAVFLGVLLNLLDALSYGIILFPLGEEVFKDMGPDGVSMFYVSCIVSQLVYSTGSIFQGGVGSEMIEVVPFFHKMTYLIMGKMGTSHPDALRATVITSYAMSSIITGLVFFGLGAARLGTLVSFFPHSILTGCIGGVGIFLFVTGEFYLS